MTPCNGRTKLNPRPFPGVGAARFEADKAVQHCLPILLGNARALVCHFEKKPADRVGNADLDLPRGHIMSALSSRFASAWESRCRSPRMVTPGSAITARRTPSPPPLARIAPPPIGRFREIQRLGLIAVRPDSSSAMLRRR